MPIVHVVDHPLVQHKLSLLRNKETSTQKFRAVLQEISYLLGYEATRSIALETRPIETPVASMNAPFLTKPKPAFISIMRAGNGMLEGVLQLMPSARVGHIGLCRKENGTEVTIDSYYEKFPEGLSLREVILLDPMLATGQSAVIAVDRIKSYRPRKITFACILASPEGIAYFHRFHPEVNLYTASVDECLNEKHYIVPGLGDAGDRLYGT